ncbi:3-hydroxyacyl-CoA dehydrogenase [Angustibacter sp. McL0619]|uniref:3-hydroxyacyl-CoA dehydrogenase n=1 Tax=Angustibacter sp. McL0619 TaxID=3415676 RepID=UPI003CEB360C
MSAVQAGPPVAVVGAGTMGAGIALVAAQAGHPVRLLDVREGAAATAVQTLQDKLATLAAKGRIDADEAAAAAARLSAAGSVSDLTGCAVVIEAVAERLDVKQALFTDVEAVVGPDAVLATNTSSLSVTAIAAALAHPGRVVGLHFFNPADRMRLVEVVRGDATDPSVVEAAVDLARAWGKTPVVCTSTPGFIVNRVARPYYGEAQRMVEEGVGDPATIDAILREAGGFPLGPFELTDLVGQDVNLAVSRSVWEQTFGDPRYAPTVFQQRLVDAGRLGRKSGRGVFAYGPDGTATDATPATEPPRAAPDRVVLRHDEDGDGFPVMSGFLRRVEAAGVTIERVLLDEEDLVDDDVPGIELPGGAMLREDTGELASESWTQDAAGAVLLDWAHDPDTCTRVSLSPSADCPQESLLAAVGLCQAAGVQVSVVGESPGGVVARTVCMLVNEAVELVTRGEATAEDVDVAMILGTGYPSGPLQWGDRLEAAGVDVETMLRELNTTFPTGRYRPSPAFLRMSRAGARLRDVQAGGRRG